MAKELVRVYMLVIRAAYPMETFPVFQTTRSTANVFAFNKSPLQPEHYATLKLRLKTTNLRVRTVSTSSVYVAVLFVKKRFTT